jgi:hypothetical protein
MHLDALAKNIEESCLRDLDGLLAWKSVIELASFVGTVPDVDTCASAAQPNRPFRAGSNN